MWTRWCKYLSVHQTVRFHAAVDAAHNRQGLPNVPHDHQPTRAPRDQIIPVLAKHQRIQTFIDFNGMQHLSVLKKVKTKVKEKWKKSENKSENKS